MQVSTASLADVNAFIANTGKPIERTNALVEGNLTKHKGICMYLNLTRQSMKSAALAACATTLLAAAPLSFAADPKPTPPKHEGMSADEVAKELANPNNDLAKLSFKNRYTWYDGDLPNANKQDNYTLLFQPIFPFGLGHAANGNKQVLFVRPAVPLLVEQPVFNASKRDFDGVTALGDIGFDLAYAETAKDGFLWAAGLVGSLPTASDSQVASGQWRFGPEALVGKLYKWGTLAIFPSHLWDVGGWNNEKGFSQTSIQPIFQYVMGGGWTVGTKGIYVYDWKAKQWSAPIHANVAKTVKLGSTPWQFELEVNYYAERPDPFAPQWMVSFNVTPVVHNFIEDMFKK